MRIRSRRCYSPRGRFSDESQREQAEKQFDRVHDLMRTNRSPQGSAATVDGKPVTNVQSFREALNKADPGRGVLLYLDRKGSKTFAVLKAGS
jgi:hypothetical protein